MVALTEEIMADFKNVKLFTFSTCSMTDEPNAVPIGMVRLEDPETIWIVDNYMKKTYSNIMENPRASLLVHSPDNKGSYQIKGDLEVIDHGEDYEKAREWAHSRNPNLPAKNLIVFHITDVYNVRSGPEAGNRINLL